MPKILIIRFSSIGDIVLTTPVFRCIKKQLPDAEVHFVTKQQYRIVTETNPYIDKFFYLADELTDLIKELKKEKDKKISEDEEVKPEDKIEEIKEDVIIAAPKEAVKTPVKKAPVKKTKGKKQ